MHLPSPRIGLHKQSCIKKNGRKRKTNKSSTFQTMESVAQVHVQTCIVFMFDCTFPCNLTFPKLLWLSNEAYLQCRVLKMDRISVMTRVIFNVILRVFSHFKRARSHVMHKRTVRTWARCTIVCADSEREAKINQKKSESLDLYVMNGKSVENDGNCLPVDICLRRN